MAQSVLGCSGGCWGPQLPGVGDTGAGGSGRDSLAPREMQMDSNSLVLRLDTAQGLIMLSQDIVDPALVMPQSNVT